MQPEPSLSSILNASRSVSSSSVAFIFLHISLQNCERRERTAHSGGEFESSACGALFSRRWHGASRRTSSNSISPFPSVSTSPIIDLSSSSVGFCPNVWKTIRSSSSVTWPSPSLSKSWNASRNSAICCSVSCSSPVALSMAMLSPEGATRARAAGSALQLLLVTTPHLEPFAPLPKRPFVHTRPLKICASSTRNRPSSPPLSPRMRCSAG